MANRFFKKGAEHILNKTIDMDTDNLKVLLTSGYTPADADDHLDDIAAGKRIGVSGNLAGASITNGVFDATDVDVTCTGNAGKTFDGMVLYQDSGVEGTSALIVFIDTFKEGLPIVPSTETVSIQFSSSGIFKL